MKTVATIGPLVRLIVLQFLVPKELVPAVVPSKGPDKSPSPIMPSLSGVEVLKSTSGVYLLDLFDGICPGDGQGPYELVDSWFVPTERHWGKSIVRYVLCHKNHVKSDELHPGFIAKCDELFESLLNLADDNLWTVQGHLNPYFENNGKGVSQPTDHQVLMLGCAGRQQTTDSAGNIITVFRDGRDENNQGLGPKVPMRDKAFQLKVVDNKILLTAPEPVEEPETDPEIDFDSVYIE